MSIWPWSAVTTSTASGGSSVDEVAHQAVDRPQLGVVAVAEPAAVGHLVDAVVVGVDERLAGAHQPVDLDRERRRDLVAVQRRVAEVGGGEAGAAELVLRHDGHRTVPSRGRGRSVGGGGRERPAGVVALTAARGSTAAR